MCHAIPVKIQSRQGNSGIGEREGLEIEIDLSLLPDAKVGDQVIVHVGIALSLVSEAEYETPTSMSWDPARNLELKNDIT